MYVIACSFPLMEACSDHQTCDIEAITSDSPLFQLQEREKMRPGTIITFLVFQVCIVNFAQGQQILLDSNFAAALNGSFLLQSSNSTENSFDLDGFYISASGLIGNVVADSISDQLTGFAGFNLAFGYDFENTPVSFEIEFIREEADIDQFEADLLAGGSINVTGDVEITAIMFNARFEFRVTEGLDAYLGGGMGWSKVKVNENLGGLPVSAFLPGEVDADETFKGFAYQLKGGLSHPMSAQLDVYAGARFISFNDVGEDILSFEFGLRYHF